MTSAVPRHVICKSGQEGWHARAGRDPRLGPQRFYNLPTRFPGPPKAYEVLQECIDVDMMADGQIWLATHSNAQNTAYNLNTGDVFRWFEVQGAFMQHITTHTCMWCRAACAACDNQVRTHGLQP